MADLRCTYRLQLTPELNFRRVREVVLPYARELGVSHLYLSPVLQARHESTHGYDVVDPTRVSDGLGGEDELRDVEARQRQSAEGDELVEDERDARLPRRREQPARADGHEGGQDA